MDVTGPIAAVDECEGAATSGDVKACRQLARDMQSERWPDRHPEALRGLEVADPEPNVVDHGRTVSRPTVVDRLDAVAVRVEQEPSVVAIVVFGA